MNLPFDYRGEHLFVEQVDCAHLAREFSTPCYVYSLQAIREAYRAYADALSPGGGRVYYAVKANGNLAVLQQLSILGAGFDIVSVGELARVLAAGAKAETVVFSGVGKTAADMRSALTAGIECFNVESVLELQTLSQVATELGLRAAVALRVNPDIDAKTHPYIATGLAEHKFGIPIAQAIPAFDQAAQLPGIQIRGLACHIGSQIFDLDAFVSAACKIRKLAHALNDKSIKLEHVDLGGGLAIGYGAQPTPDIGQYVAAVLAPFAGTPWRVNLEPGRSIIGAAGCLLTRVIYIKPGKTKAFAIVDAAMNDLLRPALYSAEQPIVNTHKQTPLQPCDVVGPVCESADFLGRDRQLYLERGELLAVLDAGAYSFAMSSQYNGRPRAAEVMVDGARASLVRERETVQQLFAGEHLLAGSEYQ